MEILKLKSDKNKFNSIEFELIDKEGYIWLEFNNDGGYSYYQIDKDEAKQIIDFLQKQIA